MSQKGFSQIIFVILAILVTGFAGYFLLVNKQTIMPSNPPIDTIPNYFETQYSWGACHAEWGKNDLKINKDGNAELELSQGVFNESKRYTFTPREVSEVYEMFTRNNFFSLNQEYRSDVVDGNCSTLTLTA